MTRWLPLTIALLVGLGACRSGQTITVDQPPARLTINDPETYIIPPSAQPWAEICLHTPLDDPMSPYQCITVSELLRHLQRQRRAELTTDRTEAQDPVTDRGKPRAVEDRP